MSEAAYVDGSYKISSYDESVPYNDIDHEEGLEAEEQELDWYAGRMFSSKNNYSNFIWKDDFFNGKVKNYMTSDTKYCWTLVLLRLEVILS